MRGFRTIERTINVEANTETRLERLPLVSVEEVLAASRVAESVEDAPASVSVISSQELRGMAYPTVAQALQGVRGVYLSDDRGYQAAGFRGFGLPGAYGNRTLVLLNGQPMNDNWVWASYIGYDLRTDLEDVERIEVVRGPGSVLYGTGAISGVINIVTRPHDAETGYEVGASTADGTVGRGRARAAYDFGGGAGMWTSVQASHSSGNSYYLPEYASDSLTHGYTPASADRFNAGTWTGQFWWKAFSVQWSLNTHDKHLPVGQFETVVGDDRTRQTDTRAMIEAKLEPRISATLQSITRAHANYYGYDGYFAAVPELGGVSHETFSGVWAGLEERVVYAPTRAVRITAGGELQDHFKADQFASYEYPVATTYLDDHRTFQVGAGYAVADLTPARALKLSIGGRYDEYSTFGGSFNPRVALILKPYEAGNLKVMFGKAFRAPSIYELFYSAPDQQLPGSNLRPESMYSGEIEFSHRFTSTVLGLVSAYENVVSESDRAGIHDQRLVLGLCRVRQHHDSGRRHGGRGRAAEGVEGRVDGLCLVLVRAPRLPEGRFVFIRCDAGVQSHPTSGSERPPAPRLAPRRRTNPRPRAQGHDAGLVHERPLRHPRHAVDAQRTPACSDGDDPDRHLGPGGDRAGAALPCPVLAWHVQRARLDLLGAGER